MEMKKCSKGHYYDVSIHQECPYCTGKNETASAYQEDERTMPLMASDDERTMPLMAASADNDDERTVALIRKDMGIDPVVGWLVCVEGKEKGRDYRIHTDNNYLGRSERMDICIYGDNTISRDNHLTISYDRQGKAFYCSPGDGRSIVRLNDKAIFQTTELKAYDRITAGDTVLLFVPMCGDKFQWQE